MIRYQTLDRCFRNKYIKYSADDLLQAVNEALYEFNGSESYIKKRQLYDDIRFMESAQGWSIPLLRVKDGRKVLMCYDDTNFSISKQPLTEDEKSKLQTALEVLSRFSGAPQFEWIQQTLPVLRDKLHLTGEHREFIALDANPDLKGLGFLPLLYEAISKKRVLKVAYKHFRTDYPASINFHPYFLKEYNKRWFAFGRNEEKDINTWNLALDRIESISFSDTAYTDDKTDWEDYFYDIIGVTKPANSGLVQIELRLDDKIAPYLLTKPLHPSQKRITATGEIRITIEVIPNLELRALLLSYAPSVEVISPESMRKELYEIFAIARDKHVS